jgi:hypothetical protein
VLLVAEHWPQAPLPWHAGVVLGHSASAPQARHACVAVLHTGVVPPHCAFDVHGTHVAVAVSHAGVAPVQAVAFVAEHCAQAPVDWHAGVAPPQSVSPAQARHACVAVLQTGVVPPHCAFDVHGTHRPAGV